MSLAPPWSKEAAVLGLEIQLAQLRATCPDGWEEKSGLIREFNARIRLIEEMKL